MRVLRSECAAVRLAVVQPLSRPQKQRRCTHCFVFLEDDALAQSPADRAGPAAHGGHSYVSAADDPLLVKGALTDAQLQDAITQVIGPSGLPAAEANEGLDEEDEGEEDIAASYSDVWGDASVDKGMLPYQELGRLIDGPISAEAGRADVQALEAMQTRLQKPQLSEAQSGSYSVEIDGALPLEEAEEPQPPVEEAEEVVLLPEIQHPSECKPHRMSNDTSAFLTEMSKTAKFLDRWTVFSKQLHGWGYHDARNPAPKRTMNSFARSNPDLLYMVPVRGLHIFVKKFRAFPSRSLDRKFRAAAARLGNVYVDFQIQPTFNGNACFQDVARLLLFVATSEFAEIEETAPGIVAAASDLLVEILVASTQPPSELARADHSGQWRDARASLTLIAASNRASTTKSKKRNVERKQKRSSQLHDEEADLAAERRLESMEEKLAASLRKGSGQGSARPWTPWDNVSKDSGFGSGSAPKSTRHMQRGRKGDGTAESRTAGESSRSGRSEAEGDVWGGDDGSTYRKAARDADAKRSNWLGRADKPSQQQKQRRGSESRKDFMSLVGDGAVDGAGSKGQPPRDGGAGRGGGDGSPRVSGGGYSGGVGLL